MAEDSTRSSAARATASMSTSCSSSSCMRYSIASSTRMRWRLVRPWKRLPSMSFMLMPISSTPCGPATSMVGKLFSRTSISTRRLSSLPSRSCARSFSRVRCDWSSRPCPVPGEAPWRLGVRGEVVFLRVEVEVGGGARREQEVEDALFGVQLGLVGDLVDLLGAHHVHGDLREVADHALHVAADVADLGELRGLDLEEGRVGHAREAARDLGLADAGRADHDDVLGHHVGGHLGRELLAADAVAQRDGDGALGGVLADDVLVELGHDLPRRHLVELRRLFGFA